MVIERSGVSVVVPVYKEEANVRPFLQRLEGALTSAGLSARRGNFCLTRPQTEPKK